MLNTHKVQEEPHLYKVTDIKKTKYLTIRRPKMKKTKQSFVTFSNFKNFTA